MRGHQGHDHPGLVHCREASPQIAVRICTGRVALRPGSDLAHWAHRAADGSDNVDDGVRKSGSVPSLPGSRPEPGLSGHPCEALHCLTRAAAKRVGRNSLRYSRDYLDRITATRYVQSARFKRQQPQADAETCWRNLLPLYPGGCGDTPLPHRNRA